MVPEQALDILDGAFHRLRQSWQADWPGLQAVLAGCIQWLTEPAAAPSRSQADVLARLLDCAGAAEAMGAQMQADGLEPPYHNRLHTADTLVSCAMLLSLHRVHAAGRHRFPSDLELTCLLTLLLHDLGHGGRINATPHENERRSVDPFKPMLQARGFEDERIRTVEALVLLTEPQQAIDLHRGARQAERSDFHLMSLIVTEADILASALPFPGLALTEALASEWSSHSPDKAQHLQTPQGRLGFLRHAANFSSPASQLLGIQAVIDAQMARLNAQAATGEAASAGLPRERP